MRKHFVRGSRYCHADAERLLASLDDDRVLNGVIETLQVPGKASHLKALSIREKADAIETQIRFFRDSPTSLWKGCAIPEVYAATIFRSNLPQKVKSQFFAAAKKEADLLAPIVAWLKTFDLTAYGEVPVGTKRIDVVGHRVRRGVFGSEEFFAVELKNEREQLKRGLDQMTTFADYSNQVYLACTPWMAADYLDYHSEANGVRRWDGDVLTNKLARFGFGLLLVEGETVVEVLEPKTRAPQRAKAEEIGKALGKLRAI